MKSSAQSQRAVPLLGLAIGLFVLLWAYWTGFVQMSEKWETDPQYSHGYLVPIIALVLLWYRHSLLRMGPPAPVGGRLGWGLIISGAAAMLFLPAGVVRDWGFLFASIGLVGAGLLLVPKDLDADKLQPSWWGLPLLAVGVALHQMAGYFYIEWFAHLSLIPALAGLVLLTVGWRGIRWSWPAILFVLFMVPLPHSLEGVLRDPLRKVGTKASTFLMQTCSLPAFADGHRNEIVVGAMTHRIGVAEACSGLSMLMIFFALAAAVAVVMKRSIWERMFVVASAVPIAVLVNVLRITITGTMLYKLDGYDIHVGLGSLVLIDMSGTEFAQSFFHDWAGWMMMPIALGLLWLELAILKRIIVVEEVSPLTIGSATQSPTPSSASEDSRTSTPKVQSMQDVGVTASAGGTR